MHRIPQVKTLHDLLPGGAAGGKEFANIVDILLFHMAQERNEPLTLLSDASGDYAGLDSFATRAVGTTGHQYKFFASPFSNTHRSEIKNTLVHALKKKHKSKLQHWILVTPEDLTETQKRGGGDVTWWESLRTLAAGAGVTIEHWGHKALQALFLKHPNICLYYYPELVSHGPNRRKSLQDIRRKYIANLDAKHRKIRFVGTSVYKPETSRDVAMEHIYIPLQLVSESADDTPENIPRRNPITILADGGRHVILGDPGSGKSTLLRFLALAGQTRSLQERFKVPSLPDKLPIFVILRRYADALKSNPNTSLIDHIVQTTQADFSLKAADLDFFEFYLESGRALLCFDGLDELPDSSFKETVRDRIIALLHTYPGNTCIVTSRIVGYDSGLRFGDDFAHHKVSRLGLSEIKQFVHDWYVAREDSKSDRESSIQGLVQVIQDPDHEAIRDLARNPLLLTIIALVHRIDAVLPDERVVLYQKCTETLLNTWHTWKYKDQTDGIARTRVERWNRARIEGIAHWMQQQSVDASAASRAVVSHDELNTFLVEHIRRETGHETSFDAEAAADAFLRFVRTRAGLLVEVGDGQYSFVHLTFQEYLTCAHILTLSESGGADAIWERIRSVTALDRWNETIRLLVASLRADDTKRLVLDRLLSQCEEDCTPQRTALLLGLLVDGLEQARHSADAILRAFLRAALESRKSVDYVRLTSRVRSLLRRQPTLWGDLAKEAHQLCSTSTSVQGRAIQLAALTVSSQPTEALRELATVTPLIDSRAISLVDGGSAFHTDTLIDASIEYALMQPTTNLIATCTLGITLGSSRPHAENHAFRMLVAAILSGPGPFYDLVRNFRALWGFEHICPELSTDRFNLNGLSRPNWIEALRVHPKSKRTARDRVAIVTRLANLADRRSATLSAQHTETLRTGSRDAAWDTISSDGQLAGLFADMVSLSIGLPNRLQWKELLQNTIFPRLRSRSFDTHIVQETLRGKVVAGREDLAGLLLLLGAAGFLHSVGPRPGSFERLESHGRSRSADPAVRFGSLCFRAASDDREAAAELGTLLKADAGPFAKLLDSIGWQHSERRTPEAHPREQGSEGATG